jgi:hypothetical protein
MSGTGPPPACPPPGAGELLEAVGAAHRFFERESGWAPPTTVTLAEWLADGACRCPDDCFAVPRGWCQHGIASWWLVFFAVRLSAPSCWDPALLLPHPDRLDLSRADAVEILEAHENAIEVDQLSYIDPGSGLFVMTARRLWDRGECCRQGCRHCPWYAEVNS